jgi:hypothetical protein
VDCGWSRLGRGFIFLLGKSEGAGVEQTKLENIGRAQMERPRRIFRSHQLAFDSRGRSSLGQKMNRYNELKLKVLSLFAATQSEWLGPKEAAEKLDFFPARSAWTYLKRLWSFGLLERRSRGRGTLGYRISELGRSRLRWLRSQPGK